MTFGDNVRRLFYNFRICDLRFLIVASLIGLFAALLAVLFAGPHFDEKRLSLGL